MKLLVMAFCTALFVFALASAWSDMLQPQLTALTLKSPHLQSTGHQARPSQRLAQTPDAPADAIVPPSGPHVAAKSSSQSRATIAFDENPATLREQMATVDRREARLVARQETLQLIYDDIQAELALVEMTRRRAADALIAAEQRVVTAAHRGTMPDSRDRLERGHQAEAARSFYEAPKPSTDSPAVRSAVLLVRQLVNQGSLDTAVSLLRRMKQREAAKILTALDRDDPQLASRLMNLLSTSTEPTRSE